jgi:hypothetical protein
MLRTSSVAGVVPLGTLRADAAKAAQEIGPRRMPDTTEEEGGIPPRYDQSLIHNGSATCIQVKTLGGRVRDRTAKPSSRFDCPVAVGYFKGMSHWT